MGAHRAKVHGSRARRAKAQGNLYDARGAETLQRSPARRRGRRGRVSVGAGGIHRQRASRQGGEARGVRRAETFARGSVSEQLGARWGHCAKLAPWGESEPGRTTGNVGTAFPTRHGFFPRARKRRRSFRFHAPIDVRTEERASPRVPKWGYDAACQGGPEILATLALLCSLRASRFAHGAGRLPRTPLARDVLRFAPAAPARCSSAGANRAERSDVREDTSPEGSQTVTPPGRRGPAPNVRAR